MANVFDKAAELGIVPVLSIPDVSHAVPLVKGLAKGGLPLIEVMFRIDAALDSIREISRKNAGDLCRSRHCGHDRTG